MKFLQNLHLSGVVCALLISTATLLGQDADARFDQLAKDYVAEFPALAPVGATQLGDHRFDGMLDEVSQQAQTRRLNFYRAFSERLASIPRGELSRDRQVDAALLKNRLESRQWSLETLQEWAWNPLVYTRLAGGAIYSLMSREFAPAEQRLNNVSARLEQLPRLFGQVRETLVPSRVPRVHAETAIKQNRGILSMLDNMVVPLAGTLNTRDCERLDKAIAIARTAIEEQEHWLTETLLPAAKGDFRMGVELFDTKLRYTLHTPLTRQQVKERADAEFDRVRREMYDVSKRVYLKQHPYTVFPDEPTEDYRQAIIRSALEITYLDMPGRDEIVSTAKAQVEEATQFVIDHQIVSVLPDPLEVIIMPEFRRGVSVAYCDSPGPLDQGLKTYYAVSPLPEDWSDEQVLSFLREYNIWSMHDLTMHEAVPGHFLQLAHSNRYPSTLRAILSSGPFIEGWAVYSERVMVDAGYLNGDDRMRLINLKWYLRGITNALIDQAIHVDGMTEEEAMRLMIEGGFQEEREAAGKWTRAQLTFAQLSTYFVGTQEHWDMRRTVEREWGDQFALLDYHDQVLSFGSPPVQFVKALLLDLPIPD